MNSYEVIIGLLSFAKYIHARTPGYTHVFAGRRKTDGDLWNPLK